MKLRVAMVVVSATLPSCDAPEPRYAVVDTPAPTPKPVEGPPRPPDEVADEPDPELVAECVRGTGRNAEGQCEALRRKDLEFVQRVQLPRGQFIMGDIPVRYDASQGRADPAARWSGNPPRKRSVDPFWIDLHEVTRAAYAQCVSQGDCTEAECPPGSDLPGEDEAEELGEVPQTCVTHAQARAYCRAHDGRLPTEAEWEYAARGVDARIFPWGNDLRDEYRQALLPVSGPVDLSYFGIRGMGTNAVEWVADPFELDVGLSPFVTAEFRDERGPLARWLRERGEAHVVKGGRAGGRAPQTGAAAGVGFRCAEDLAASDTALEVPEPSAEVPLIVNADPGMFFGGVAEAVTRAEAEAFCAALSVESFTGWRLPTLEEISQNAAVFRGPGPFWTQEGAASQQAQGRPAEPEDPWVSIEAESSEPLAARCVRP